MSRQHPWRRDRPDAIRVDRSTRWGNPFTVEEHGSRAAAVAVYREALLAGKLPGIRSHAPVGVADVRAELAGQGAALGLRFYLVAGILAVVLAGAALLSGTVEASTADLANLRTQGLAARRAATVEPVAAVLLVAAAGFAAVPAAAAVAAAKAARRVCASGANRPFGYWRR